MPLESPLFWIILTLGVLITGISKSGFAGSIGVIAVPLLTMVTSLELAAALMLPILIVMDAQVIRYYWREVNWPSLRRILPAALCGILIGTWMLQSAPTRALEFLLGALCLVFAAWHRLNTVLGRLPGAAMVWGSFAGFTSTLIHAGGPPVSIYFAGRQLPKLQWLASAAVFFGVLNLIKIVPYVYLGLWSRQLLVLALLCIPVAWFGVWIGRAIQQRFSDVHFLLISRVMVFCSGVLLIFKAVKG